MRLRLTAVDEYQFLTCLKHGLWGSKTGRFREWRVGDYLAFKVGTAIAGLAEVCGAPFVDQEKVWDNGVFPHRIPIRFHHVLVPDQRVPILGDVRDSLMQAYGSVYGWGILNQALAPSETAEVIAMAVTSRPNGLSEFQANLLPLLDEAKILREASNGKKKPAKVTKGPPTGHKTERPADSTPARQTIVPREDESLHSRTQDALIQLGKVTGCSVWIASNDRNRAYNGRILGDKCLKELPSLGLSNEATNRISLIDIIWVRQSAPVCAFEVETTTTVYSGLLRMSDLLAVTPALNIKLFIVAPRDRLNKVMAELGRPTFQKIGLSEFCRFVPLEELEALLAKVSGLAGHVQPSLVDTVAVGLDQSAGTALR